MGQLEMLSKQSAAYQARQARYRQWEAQQAYLRYRQGEWADPQPAAQSQPTTSNSSKPWWQRAGEWIQQKVVQPVQQAVPKVMNWIDQHQKEIAIGVGIAAGVAAIVLSGGAATPLVAAAWVAGSAAVAGGVAALGTVGLNAYFHRPLGTNVLRNLGYAAGVAAVTATAGFALQAVAPTVTRAAAQFCLGHVTTCSVAAPAFKAADYAWTGYDVWQSQRTLNNPRARADEKLLAAVNIGLAAWSESLEPDDALAIGLPLDDVARREVLDKFRKVLAQEGEEAALKYLQQATGVQAPQVIRSIYDSGGLREIRSAGEWERIFEKGVRQEARLDVHHLIEQRFAERLGLKESEVPAVVLDRTFHWKVTGKLFSKESGLPTKGSYSAQQIWEAYKRVYGSGRGGLNQPDWLEAIWPYFERLGVQR